MIPLAASPYTAHFCSHRLWRLELPVPAVKLMARVLPLGTGLRINTLKRTSYKDVSDFIFKHLTHGRQVGAAMPGRSSVARRE